MIHIAFIIDQIWNSSGGTEKQLLMLLDEIDKSKFKPYLICLRNSEWLQNNNLPYDVYILDVHSIISFAFIKGLIKFKKLHKDKNFDIIQTFFIDGNIFGTFASKFCGISNLISSRRNIGYWHNNTHILILRLLKRWTSYYLCNSKAAQEKTVEVEKVNFAKTHVIYNGLHLDMFKSLDQNKRDNQRTSWHIKEDEILIGTVANLRAVKNIDMLIESASRLMSEFTHLKFVVIGEGQMENVLQQKIDKFNLTDNFILAGRFDDITDPLAAFDIAVMPSLSESFSNSLIEYMAAKLPIVSSDAGGNSEAISHNVNGLLFPLSDKMGLYNNIKRLILDKLLAEKLAQNAFLDASKNYPIETMVKKHQLYYEDII